MFVCVHESISVFVCTCQNRLFLQGFLTRRRRRNLRSASWRLCNIIYEKRERERGRKNIFLLQWCCLCVSAREDTEQLFNSLRHFCNFSAAKRCSLRANVCVERELQELWGIYSLCVCLHFSVGLPVFLSHIASTCLCCCNCPETVRSLTTLKKMLMNLLWVIRIKNILPAKEIYPIKSWCSKHVTLAIFVFHTWRTQQEIVWVRRIHKNRAPPLSCSAKKHSSSNQTLPGPPSHLQISYSQLQLDNF